MTETQAREAVVSIMKGWLGWSESDGRYKKIIDIYNAQKPLPHYHSRFAKLKSAFSYRCGREGCYMNERARTEADTVGELIYEFFIANTKRCMHGPGHSNFVTGLE